MTSEDSTQASRATRLASEVLYSGLDDWVALLWIEGWARRAGAEPGDETKTPVLGVLEQLVVAGLIELGEVSPSGYSRWDEPLAVSLARIDHAWSTTDPYQYGFMCWTRNTPEGNARAMQEAGLRR